MVNASSPEGSCTMTGWKRRSKAESFSKYLRCSSRVVAPMQCNWPRARAGFIKLLMSRPPLRTDPPPTSMWISSILHHRKQVSTGIASAKASRTFVVCKSQHHYQLMVDLGAVWVCLWNNSVQQCCYTACRHVSKDHGYRTSRASTFE